MPCEQGNIRMQNKFTRYPHYPTWVDALEIDEMTGTEDWHGMTEIGREGEKRLAQTSVPGHADTAMSHISYNNSL